MSSQAIGDVLQEKIAGVAPERVVDDAELLYVQNGHRAALWTVCGLGHQSPKAFAEQRPPRQAGLRIEVREEAHRAVLLQVLHSEGKICCELTQHAQLMIADDLRPRSGEQQHADSGLVDDE